MKRLAGKIFLLCILILFIMTSYASAQQQMRVGLFYNGTTVGNATVLNAKFHNSEGLKASLIPHLANPVQTGITYTTMEINNAKQEYVQIGAFSTFGGAYALALDARQKSLSAYVAYRPQDLVPYRVWTDGTPLVGVRMLYPDANNVSVSGNFVALACLSSGQVGLIMEGNYLRLEPVAQNATQFEVSQEGISTKIIRSYEGAFDLSVRTTQNVRRISIINIIDLEPYIFGVVPYEVSDSWPIEAIKAQAVAARSYAIVQRGRNKHGSLGFHVCDTTCCQVYRGVNNSFINSRRAVDETAGLVAFYNGSTAETLYHSNSGGHTENANEVWSGNGIFYLQAMSDPFSVAQPLLTYLSSRQSNPTEFPARWLRSYTRENMEGILRERLAIEVGTLLEIRSLGRSAGGRHTQLLIRGSAGELVLDRNKAEDRTMFDALHATTVLDLRSRLYEIIPVHQRVHVVTAGGDVKEVPVNGNLFAAAVNGARPVAGNALNVVLRNSVKTRTVSKIPSGFSFDGRGWGHGVGMSQWGAFEMARQGYNYEEILKYYYQGITISAILNK